MRLWLCWFLLALPALPVDGAVVRYRFEATLIDVEADDDGLLAGVAPGTSFTGSFWYDTDVADTLASPSQGDYHQPSYVDAVIGGTLFFHRGERVYIRVRNGATDSFSVGADALGPDGAYLGGPARMHYTNLGIELGDPTGAMLASDALPTAATLSPFATGEFTISGAPFAVSRSSLRASGAVTAITRAPAPVAHVRGDLNGDGTRDLLWRSDTGVNEAWYMDGNRRLGVATLPRLANPDWQTHALGDFTADGRNDLVWRNGRTGGVAVWQMNGRQRQAVINLPKVGLKWELGDAADLNADGFNDLVWRHRTTGAQRVWFMEGTAVTANAALPAMADATWQYSGASDFDGDGADDLVWRDGDTGRLGVWLMEGASRKGVVWITGRMGKHWAVEGVGDYDGDGDLELLFALGHASRIAQLDGYRITRFEALPNRPADTTAGGTWGVSGTTIQMTDVDDWSLGIGDHLWLDGLDDDLLITDLLDGPGTLDLSGILGSPPLAFAASPSFRAMAVAIPEPASAAAGLLAAGLLVCRRR